MAEPFELTTTARGFAILRFADRCGAPCSLQKSSLAGEDCIWLGRDGTNEPGRMLLTQEMAAALLPHLQRFAETGELHIDEAEGAC